MTIFLGTVGGGRLKSEILTAIMGRQFGRQPHATDYGPIVIVIETPRKFLCMFPNSRSITHVSVMVVTPFFWAQWVIEG